MTDFNAALKETTATYDAVARDMAEWQWATDFGPYLGPFVDRIRNRRLPVVDAGCGTGRDVSAMTHRGIKCIGLDLSEGMLRAARDKVNSPLATWVRADVRSMPIGDGTAAGVWTNSTLLHLEPAAMCAALGEFRRVTTGGGPLFVSTLAGEGSSTRESGSGMRRWFWGCDEDALRSSLERSGFRIVSSATEPGIVRGLWVNVLAVAE